MDITHDNVCSSMLSCFYSHLLSTGRPISSSLSFLADLSYMYGLAIYSCSCSITAVNFSFMWQNIQTYYLAEKSQLAIDQKDALDLRNAHIALNTPKLHTSRAITQAQCIDV